MFLCFFNDIVIDTFMVWSKNRYENYIPITDLFAWILDKLVVLNFVEFFYILSLYTRNDQTHQFPYYDNSHMFIKKLLESSPPMQDKIWVIHITPKAITQVSWHDNVIVQVFWVKIFIQHYSFLMYIYRVNSKMRTYNYNLWNALITKRN